MSEDAATADPGVDSETAADPEAGVDSEAGIDLTEYVPLAGIAVLYVATVLGGMALADEMNAVGLVAFEDPQNVGNVGVFAVEVLVATVVIVLAERYGVGKQLIRLVMLAIFGLAVSWLAIAAGLGTHAAGFPTSPLPVAVGLVTLAVLWVFPEWYVLDLVAVLAGAAMIPALGLSFGPLPIVVLLVAWAAYDAYAVYVSGHMKELASGAGDLKAPMLYVVPAGLDYSMRSNGLDLALDPDESDAGEADPAGGNDDGRDPAGGSEGSEGTPGGAIGNDTPGDDDVPGKDGTPVQILGLGDSIIPGMLAVSAGQFLPAREVIGPLNANLPALGALAGGVVGMAALLYVVRRFEGAHAGLPPLNAGVLLGYLAGAVAAGVPVTVALGI